MPDRVPIPTPLIVSLLLIVLLLLTACGPTLEVDTADVTTRTPAVVPTESAENAAELTIAVRPGSQEVTAGGIPVGFTEEGFAFVGDPAAPVVIDEFSDFQCPFCGRFYEQTLPALKENQLASGEAVIVFYDFPLTQIHPQAPLAAEAAHCAGEAGAVTYWMMHDILFERMGSWSNNPAAQEMFVGFAEEMGLDGEAFTACLESGQYTDLVQRGLESGIARGVNSTPSFFINGQPLIGAQPVAAFNRAITVALEGGTVAEAEPAAPSAPGAAPTPASFNDNVAATLGDPDAPVTIVEFTDYQCPYCARHAAETMPALREQFVESGKVYYILKDLPLQSHPQAQPAAVAARCAGEQGAYWEMHDALFANQQRWSGDTPTAQRIFNELAKELGLEEEPFSACLESGRFDDLVQANLNEALALGANATPFFFIDGYPIPGAQPLDLFAYAIRLAEEGTLADAYEPQPTPTPPVAREVPVGDAFAIGDPDAPVTIVEYTDFQCPFCRRYFEETFHQIVENHVETGQVRYVFKDFPLQNIHPQAVKAAEAARCAGEQEAFLAMHDQLFIRQDQWSNQDDAVERFVAYSEELGLDSDALAACLESGRYEDAVLADLAEGTALGVTGTPAFFVNGQLVPGAYPYETFEQLIEAELAQ